MAKAPAMAMGRSRIVSTAKATPEIQPLFSMKNHNAVSIVKHAGTNHAATRNSRRASVGSEYCGPLAMATTIAPETPPTQVA